MHKRFLFGLRTSSEARSTDSVHMLDADWINNMNGIALRHRPVALLCHVVLANPGCHLCLLLICHEDTAACRSCSQFDGSESLTSVMLAATLCS